MRPILQSLQWTLGAALFLIAACQSAPVQQASASDEEIIPAASLSEPYKLGPADKVKVTVFGEPELSGEYVVDGSGNISLPLIDSFQVEGLSLPEFQKLTEQSYAQGYLREPRISAEVLNFRPFYILGEVAKPGEYPYSNGLTVMNAVATAEGFTYRANKKYVLIKKANASREFRVELTPALTIQPGDTIRVVERFF
ncbi:MAG: polysaccharide biosynthesis/export family protein [Henriciella sp.]|uniref:polysaccharide biosynthesis/export family protein n=1 Tax=Henriciella sp. TaxID=1968823 RepID=UPI003C760A83